VHRQAYRIEAPRGECVDVCLGDVVVEPGLVERAGFSSPINSTMRARIERCVPGPGTSSM